MTVGEYHSDVIHEFRRLKKLADGALGQVTDDDFFRAPDNESNSLALIVKHMAGNMRSRWRDFLTTDGEKPDRHRDTEFIIGDEDTRAALTDKWEKGWKYLLGAIEPLREEDFSKTVYIRREPHSVMQAINRQLTHYAYHVGQIVFMAKYMAGEGWQTLSVPKGRSEAFAANPDSYLGPKDK